MMKRSLLFAVICSLSLAEGPRTPTPSVHVKPTVKADAPKGETPISEAGTATESAKTTEAQKPETGAPQRAVVVKVDKRRNRLSVTDDSFHTWTRKDSVCIYRMTRAIACGKVIAVGIKGAVVQLTQKHAAAIKPGDEARYFEPDRKMPEISDDQLIAENLMEAKPYTYNIVAGYNLTLDLMYPLLHFYWAVSPNIAVGLCPAYIKKTGTTAGDELSGFGGMLTAHYFSDEYFRGMWLQLGSGFYHLTAKTTGITETSNYPIVLMTAGWREDWAHGLNIGAAVGGRFLSPLANTITGISYPSLHPIAIIEVGLSF